MSEAIFPKVRGLSWSCVDRMTFSTIVKRAASRKTTRAALAPYPLWEFDLSYEFLFDDVTKSYDTGGGYSDLELIQGFLIGSVGPASTFLWEHPKKNLVSGQQLAVSDGTTTVFQAARNLGGYVEPVQAVNGTPVITDALGAALVVASVSDTGLITTTTPAAAGPVTAEFSYYFRVRFKDDDHDFEELWRQLYTLRKLTLVQEPL